MTQMVGDKCFACDRKIAKGAVNADTRDGQVVIVGPECYRKIRKAGAVGYQPPKGGPRLFDNCARPPEARGRRR